MNGENRGVPTASIAAVYSGGLFSADCMQAFLGFSSEVKPLTPLRNSYKPAQFIEQLAKEYPIHFFLTLTPPPENLKEIITSSVNAKLEKDGTAGLTALFPEKNINKTVEDYKNLITEIILTTGSNAATTGIEKTLSQNARDLYLKLASKKTRHIKEISYSKHEIDFIKNIQDKIEAGSLVTAASEINETGVISEHAYTVLGVEKKQISYNKEAQQEIYYVRIRNPWGHTGRIYNIDANGNEQVSKTEDGVFLVELKDFYRLFSDITLSEAKNSVFENAAYQEGLEKKTRQLLSSPIHLDTFSFSTLLSEDTLISEATQHLKELSAQGNKSYREEWSAIDNRRHIIQLILMHEANHFHDIYATLEKDIHDFLNKNAQEVRSIEDLALTFISLKNRFSILEAHLLYLQKFSHHLTEASRNVLSKIDNDLHFLNGTLSEEKQKIQKITSTLGNDISHCFNEISDKTLALQRHVLDWNHSRLLSDAAASAITTAVAQQNFNKPFISEKDSSSAETIATVQKEINLINSLIGQFKTLLRKIILPQSIEHTIGNESASLQKQSSDKILNPLDTVIKRLEISNTDEMIQFSIALQEIRNRLAIDIKSERKEGISYFDIENGNIGRIVKNIVNAFDESTCDQLSLDLNSKEKINAFITQLRAQKNPIRQETLCCSFALDCALSNHTTNDDIDHFRKTHLRLKKIKTNNRETIIKSEAYLLMRNCVRENSKENQSVFAAFIEKPEVKKSTVGKTIAIGMLGFLGVVGIAALVVATHGLALPLIPILVAKGVAAGSLTASVLGLGGLAGKKKLKETKTKSLKNQFFSFFSSPKEAGTKEAKKDETPTLKK